MQLNPVDLLLVAIVLVGAWAGWSRGFLFAALDLLTLAVSLAAAFLGWREIADLVNGAAPALGVWIAPLSFVVIFLLVHFLLGLVVLRLLRRLPGKVHGHGMNRALGIVPGAANGLVHAVVAAVLLLTLPLGARVGTWAHDSALATRFSAPAEWVEAQLAQIFDPAVERTLRVVTVKPESREGVPLAFHVAEAPPRPDLEAQMLDLVNAERRSAGLEAVKPDPVLTQVARAHSQDMFARGYFSHYTPEGRDLEDRLRTARIGYLTAGENLALAPSLYTAHTGLMHSPGHRANILRPQFGRLGIGILDGGIHGLMVTQAFRN
ncbi:CvpA family protein [Ramlibacter sp. USB13]|uniref:CvpA family protein n=1 Tax=Ramlibacter cellulosilyticus TaxID=2764187 RepID=A0A923SDR1_9BURK|nr:CvpA family protein [Ramlibacter cellulosilyticus]MBC5786189.1 CvpA family protein [Ramlibacter cellulosilyticus]